ncbi:hypothetical protein MiYa_04700 [Microcystis aeruginosa NIES-2519]|uniref:Uncharacterized protein n=1 Tax=Microcystis aeruginosa NIES-2519 TaxID=2303981 RepID=A0A5A5RJ90_MICAE|nr:hypothetical protein MiYa_04700 [Microcystis aeruginosa NIES-2519]
MTRSSAIAVILSFLVLFIALKIIFHWSSPLDIFRGILIILFFGYFPSILAILVGNTLDNTDRFNPEVLNVEKSGTKFDIIDKKTK